MVNRNGKTSIIITNYNYENYIDECIQSCLNQVTVYPFEVIVIDDGSNDNSIETINKYRSSIIIIQSENAGIEKASNKAIEYAKGEFVVRVDADDVLEKNYLAQMIPIIIDSDYSFVYCNYSIIDANGKIIKEFRLPEFSQNEIETRGDFLATGTLYRKIDIASVGLYNENIKNCGLENYELILKLLHKNKKGYLLNKNLFLYRRHNNNLSELKKIKIIEYGNSLAKRFNVGKYQTNDFHPYGLEL